MHPSPQPSAQAGTAARPGLDDPRIKAVITRLHDASKRDIFLLLRMIPVLLLAKLKGVSPKTTIDPFVAKGFFAVFPTVGNLLYLTARAIVARHAVEF